MASSSSSLSLPLQLLRFRTSSSSRVGPSPASVRLRQPARSLRPIAAVSYHGEASGHGDDGIAAATSVLLRQLDGNAVVAELRAARTVSRAAQPRKPKEGGGGSGGKIHAAASTGKPKEGSGGQGGSIN
ncbi:unnamed protein product [Urochloa decumbens]|uniref:Uncharacterized protein n=1 Tax=Urochloa decumbens TaxID=240449 RepID=A0ABC9BQR3_9POAL